MKILSSHLFLVRTDGQNGRNFIVEFLQFFFDHPPEKKKLSRDQCHADVGW